MLKTSIFNWYKGGLHSDRNCVKMNILEVGVMNKERNQDWKTFGWKSFETLLLGVLGFVALQFFFLGFVAAEQCSTDYEVFM
jgi:hypothetical protein